MSSARRAGRIGAAALALGVVLSGGCYSSGAGQDPDEGSFYFPVGVALSQSGDHLFVVNSDFDLRYNAGTLQALDVRSIAACARGETPRPARATQPPTAPVGRRARSSTPPYASAPSPPTSARSSATPPTAPCSRRRAVACSCRSAATRR